MNKKELMNRGLSEEHADIVVDMIKDSFVPLYRFNEINEKMKTYKSKSEELDEEVKALTSKVEDTEKLKADMQKLKDENARAAGEHLAALASLKKSNAIDAGLRDSKAKNVKAVKALLDLDKITLEGDTLTGLEEQVKALMENDNSKFMFDTATEYTPKGANPGQASGGSASTGNVSFVDAIKNAINVNK